MPITVMLKWASQIETVELCHSLAHEFSLPCGQIQEGSERQGWAVMEFVMEPHRGQVQGEGISRNGEELGVSAFEVKL